MDDLVLRSRVERIGNRNVQIHEMTASDIAFLHDARWMAFFGGVFVGFIVGAMLFSIAR